MDTSHNSLSSEQAQQYAEQFSQQTLGFAGSVRFLSTVKAIQLEKRKQRSAMLRSTSMRSNTLSLPGGMDPRRVSSERTPLKQDELEPLEGLEDEEAAPTTFEALKEIVLGKGIVSCCLLAAPFAIYAHYGGWSPTWVFWLNFWRRSTNSRPGRR